MVKVEFEKIKIGVISWHKTNLMLSSVDLPSNIDGHIAPWATFLAGFRFTFVVKYQVNVSFGFD